MANHTRAFQQKQDGETHMICQNKRYPGLMRSWLFTSLITLVGFLLISSAHAITVNVVGPDGTTPVSGFRWTLEEDNTHAVTPGAAGATDTLSFDFHASHAPTLGSGISTGGSADIPLTCANATDRYFISVTPHTAYNMSGVSVNCTEEQVDPVLVTVNALPIPTAQISVFAFEDNFPINNAPDLPQEQGLADFDVLLIDAAGTYGQAGGQVIQDAFGNPLGTTYLPGTTTVDVMGTGVLKTGADGTLLIKNLAPGKYGIQIVPPPGQDWHQTSTIEGSKVVDAWVMANEPSHFMEFGAPGHHVFIGFVHTTNDTSVLTGGSTITGQVRNLHNSRPPEYAFYTGEPVANCWIGLNELAVGAGRGLYAMPCNEDSTFAIPNVPEGNYQLVVWDEALFTIIALLGVTVPPGGGEVALNDVPVFNWFARHFNKVFWDANENGFPDDAELVGASEGGILEQAVIWRFRNGQIYRVMPTDGIGEAPQEEVFPFFHWLVTEVDYARFKATGVTYVVDAGGPVDPDQGWAYPSFDMTTPQPQPDVNPNTGNNYSTTIEGPVLTLPFQGFLGQTSHVFWGKRDYVGQENGGISGMVIYASTRAEERPMWAAAEEWEFGIPRVQVNLYQDSDANGEVDDINAPPGIQYADVDNYPLGNFPGPEDIDNNGNNQFNLGDALQVTYTDSFDDSKPSGCVGDPFIFNSVTFDCFDGMRNYNQIREGVFDGGFAFPGYDATFEPDGLMPGDYIVSVSVPPGYELLKEEDKNVDFGVTFIPQLEPAECVGAMHNLPTYLTFNSDGELPLPGVDPSELVEVNQALGDANGEAPLCDYKKVPLVAQTNAAAEFYLFTQSPKASRAVGFVLNDVANEFDPNAPTFGEKAAPPWIPVSFKDWTGKVVNRVYTDEFGKYNALLPSTFTANLPIPSGMMANVLSACVNDAAAQPNPAYQPDPAQANFNPVALINDPYHNPQFSQWCYTLQYMPGATTYLDTPVVPIAAFAGAGNFPVDCEVDNGTPKIYSVAGLAGLAENGSGTLTIYSMGSNVAVPNPAYDGTNAKTVTRDHSFGIDPGMVTIGEVVIPAANVTWGENATTVDVPPGTPSGQLMVTKASGVSTETGITVTVGGYTAGTIHQVPSEFPTIQEAIDAAAAGDLILIAPGLYEELVIMYKPVQLQGSGAGTIINAVKTPNNKLEQWRQKLKGLVVPASTRQVDLLPGQELDPNIDPQDNEPGLFTTEEGAGITVVGLENNLPGQNKTDQLFEDYPSRIDGIQINGANHGGAIFVNGWAHGLQISNNRLTGNHGSFGGGIRIGDPRLALVSNGGYNLDVTIHHNEVLQNGGIDGAGGGIALYTGSTNYQVTENWVCGNYSSGSGGGIGHLGESHNGLIANNEVVFNQSFNQGQSSNGGGIYVGGNVVAGAILSDGSGSVQIDSNLIQGNNSGAGDGGGIRLERIDGNGVTGGNPNNWDMNQIDITNNMIVNNVAGMAGGGISAQDALTVNIINNTVANNDSTATAGEAFAPGSPNLSTAQPAGIVSRAHSTALTDSLAGAPAVDPYRFYSRLNIANNIIWHNRSFRFEISLTDPSVFGLVPNIADGDAPEYDDLGVVGYAAGSLDPVYSIVTDATGLDPSNIAGDPAFVAGYVNGARDQTIAIPEVKTSIATAVAFDEGGNFIDVHYGPLTLDGGNDGTRDSDYHIGGASTAIDEADGLVAPATDFDGQARPLGAADDIGADEAQ
jgi:hypothetical protein